MAGLKNILKSPLERRIISFFQENPSAVDTASGIATWLNYQEQQIQNALDLLVSQKILNTHRTGSTTAYSYTQDKRIIKDIEQLLKKKSIGGRYV